MGEDTPRPPWIRPALELGPLAIFFAVNASAGIFAATGAFMVAIVVSLIVTWRLEGRLPALPLFTAVLVLVFGGLTLALEDEAFIKLKPTLFYAASALILAAGALRGRWYLARLLGDGLALSEAGWRALTRRWIVFLFAMAALNEVLWRALSTDTWVALKVFGFLPLTLVFVMAQMPLMERHQLERDAGDERS